MTGAQIVWLFSALLGAGGVVGGVVALLKLKPERESIIVTAARGAIVVQSGVMDDLREQMDSTRAQMGAMRAELDAVKATLAEVTRERNQLRRRVSELEDERDRLRERIDHLEAASETGGTT